MKKRHESEGEGMKGVGGKYIGVGGREERVMQSCYKINEKQNFRIPCFLSYMESLIKTGRETLGKRRRGLVLA